MRKLKLILSSFVLGTLLLASCTNSFSGTDISGAAAAQTALNSANLTTVAFTANNITDSTGSATFAGVTVTANAATNQTLVVRFPSQVDTATIATGLTFYNLGAANAADGSPTRSTTISFTVTEVRYNGATYDAYLNLGLLTGASARIELYIDPSVLTFKGGTLRIDADGDNVQGEKGDDDVYKYITATGGTASAAGSRDPRLSSGSPLFTPAAFNTAVGTTTWTMAYNFFALDNTDYTSSLNNVVRLEKFSYTDGAWSNVTYTSAYVAGTGTYTITFAATAAGETYRVRTINLTGLTTTNTLYGYNQKAVLDAMTQAVAVSPTTVVNAGQLVLLNADVTVTTSFLNSKAGYIQLNFAATLGAGAVANDQGIDSSTATTTNIRVWDITSGCFVKISSITVRNQNPTSTTALNNQIILTLDPAYVQKGNTFYVYIGSGVKMLGATTAATDDLYFGNSSQLTYPPYGYVQLTSDGSTI